MNSGAIRISKILGLAICVCVFPFSLADESLEEQLKQSSINATNCPAYKQPKQHFEALVFSSDPENLSFENCGSWQPVSEDDRAPWIVEFVDSKGIFIECDGVLVTDKTVISDWGCKEVYQSFIDGNELRVHGGLCEMNNDTETCYRFYNYDKGKGLGLLNDQKVIDVHLLNFIGRPFVFVWTITPVRLSDALKPICLWNEDNSRDKDLQYFAHDDFGNMVHLEFDGKSSYANMERCYTESLIPKEMCPALHFSICTEVNKTLISEIGLLEYLLIQKSGRFYLRGFNSIINLHQYLWVDLLVEMRSITKLSTDLVTMPAIPEAKRKHDFGERESSGNCGFRENKAVELISHSNDSAIRGLDPWHASLTSHFGPDSKYNYCGATLISKRALLTSAHCLLNELGNTPNEVRFHLGSHGKADKSGHYYKAASLLIHPGYNHSSGIKRHDLALVMFNENKINFTDSVRPICLWNSDYDFEQIENKTGKVVSEALNATNLQEFDFRMTPHVECYMSNRPFYSKHLFPTENFCAKDIESSIIEEGVGLALFNSTSQRYFLRGVLSERAEGGHTLFTDVTNYIKWIVENAL